MLSLYILKLVKIFIYLSSNTTWKLNLLQDEIEHKISYVRVNVVN